MNPTFAIVDAADTTRVDAIARNQYREPTNAAVTFTACDALVAVTPDTTRVEAENPDRALVVGMTLGETCVVASAGGVIDSTGVNVVPSTMGASIAAVMGSGTTEQASWTFLDAAGNPVTGMTASDLVFSVGNGNVASVDATGLVTGKSPGTTTVNVAIADSWGAARDADSNDFDVVPGPFDGTLPASANSYDTVTVASGSVDFDDDSEVTFDGLSGYTVSQTTTEFQIVAPAGMGSSPAEVLVLNVGPNQLAFADTIDVPVPCAQVGCEDPNNSIATATAVGALPWEGWLVVGDADVADVFEFTVAGGETVRVQLWWADDGADFDAIWYEDGGGGAYNGCGTGDMPEDCSATLGAGTTALQIWIDVWDAHGNDYLMTYLTVTEVP